MSLLLCTAVNLSALLLLVLPSLAPLLVQGCWAGRVWCCLLRSKPGVPRMPSEPVGEPVSQSGSAWYRLLTVWSITCSSPHPTITCSSPHPTIICHCCVTQHSARCVCLSSLIMNCCQPTHSNLSTESKGSRPQAGRQQATPGTAAADVVTRQLVQIRDTAHA
jgi:hypothetical protein